MPTPRKPKSEHKRSGPPPFVPTEDQRKQVESMAAYGVTQAQISKIIGVPEKTMQRHFKDELSLGAAKANAKVAQTLFQKATGQGPQAVTAAIFWMKARAGWKEQQAVEHTGSIQLEDARGKLLGSLNKQLTSETKDT